MPAHPAQSRVTIVPSGRSTNVPERLLPIPTKNKGWLAVCIRPRIEIIHPINHPPTFVSQSELAKHRYTLPAMVKCGH